jgi:hypothetical protein
MAVMAFAFTTVPACEKAKQKAKELMHKQKCREGRKAVVKCYPELAKRSMKTDKERDELCLKNLRENVTHRIEALNCVTDAKGNCDKIKKCMETAIKGEIKYLKEQKKKGAMKDAMKDAMK